MVQRLSDHLECPRIIVTQGSLGCSCYESGTGFSRVPAFAGQVVDRVGAGDAFLSITSLCVVQESPMEIVGFIGNVVGAQAVATVGHRKSVERAALYKHIESLLR